MIVVVRDHTTSQVEVCGPCGQKQRMFPWKEERMGGRCRGNCLSEPLLGSSPSLTFLSFIRYSGERRCEVLKNGFDSASPALQTFRIHEQRKKRGGFSLLPHSCSCRYVLFLSLAYFFHIIFLFRPMPGPLFQVIIGYT